MKARNLAAGALAAALLVSGAPLGAGSSYAATTTRIMLAGDSITEGVDGDYTWRYRLDEEFVRQGTARSIDLVGPRRDPRGRYAHYLGGRAWDSDHYGISGVELTDQVSSIEAEVAAYRPDVLVTYLGTNDFLHVAQQAADLPASQRLVLYRERIARVMADWRTYLANARRANSNLRIVLGELITPRIPTQIRDEYNEKLTDLARELSTAQARVEVAQFAGTIWQAPRYLYDRVHPGPTGETYFAQKFAEALRLVAPATLPRTPAIQRPYVAWAAPLRTKVRVVGKRVKLDWTYSFKYNRARQMRVKIDPVPGKARTTKFRDAYTWKSGTLKPGKYRISIQASRNAVKSTWSKTYTVTIK